MSQTKLDIAKKEFKQQIAKGFNLIKSITQLRPPLPKDEVYLIYEFSFLKLFLAWEWFLENTFILYIMGERTDKGYKPKTYVNPKTKKHVYDFLKEGRDYADWTSPNIVIRKANLFFKDGKPYKNHLISITQDIQDMKTLRNAIVHISKESQEKFKTLVRKRFGYAKTMITPGEFLSTPVKNKNLVYISYFRNQLEFVSDKLVR